MLGVSPPSVIVSVSSTVSIAAFRNTVFIKVKDGGDNENVFCGREAYELLSFV